MNVIAVLMGILIPFWPPGAGAVAKKRPFDYTKHKTEKFLISIHRLFKRAGKEMSLSKSA